MSRRARGNEAFDGEPARVYFPQPVAVHVGDEEHASVGAELDILRSRSRATVRETDGRANRLALDVDHDHLPENSQLARASVPSAV